MSASATAKTSSLGELPVAGQIALAVAAVGGVVGGLLLLAVASDLVDAFVFMRLWRWFVVPYGLPVLGYWAAFGILLTVRFARPNVMHAEREGDGKVKSPVSDFLVRAVLHPALVLLFGWFGHAMLT